jgi:hypothetical protein
MALACGQFSIPDTWPIFVNETDIRTGGTFLSTPRFSGPPCSAGEGASQAVYLRKRFRPMTPQDHQVVDQHL